MGENFRECPIEASSMLLDSFPDDDPYGPIGAMVVGPDNILAHQPLSLDTPDTVDFLDTALSYVTPTGSQELQFPSISSTLPSNQSNYKGEFKEHSPNSVSRTSSMVSGISGPNPLKKPGAPEANAPPAAVAAAAAAPDAPPKQPPSARFEVASGRVEKGEINGKKAAKVKKPSKYCHLCGHTASVDHRVLCRNIAEGTCRKTICRSCFLNQGWNFTSCAQNPNWECSHCRGQCPQRAQCTYYARTNRKRHMSLMMKKSEKGQDAPADGNGLAPSLALLQGLPINKPPMPAVYPVDMIALSPLERHQNQNQNQPPPPPPPLLSPREEKQHGDLLNSLAQRADVDGPGIQISNMEVPKIPDLEPSFNTDTIELQTSELTFHGGESWLYMF